MTSAIISGIAAVGALFANPQAKSLVIPSLLIFAIADNIADSFGMHMYQDAELLKDEQVWVGTIFNYCARLIISLIFIGILLLFSPILASILCIVVGLILLTLISYLIAQRRKSNPWLMIGEHVGLALVVLVLSTVVGSLIRSQIH